MDYGIIEFSIFFLLSYNKMVKGMLAPLEKTLQPLNNFLRNEYVTAVVALFVVLYASNVAPRLPDVVMDLFNNPIFRVFVLFLVAYIANKNPAVALLISIAFVVTLNVINRQEAEESFLDVIDTFNGGKKENFESACDSLGTNWGPKCQAAFADGADTDKLTECCNCAQENNFDSCEAGTAGCDDYKNHCPPATSGEETGEEPTKLVFKA